MAPDSTPWIIIVVEIEELSPNKVFEFIAIKLNPCPLTVTPVASPALYWPTEVGLVPPLPIIEVNNLRSCIV